jgi:hypothetical protein
MHPVQTIAVFAENKLGQLAHITETIASVGANIRWITIATNEDLGVMKLLVDKTAAAFSALQKSGFTVSLVEVLAIEVEDVPGGLSKVAQCLSAKGINIDNSSGYVSRNHAVLIIEVADITAAQIALSGSGLQILSAVEMTQ